MIVSRTLAKGRIARGERPSWLAAWAPVLLDFVLFCGYVALVFSPLMKLIYAGQPGDGATFVIMLVVIFIPMQVVLIVSSLWASKSRFKDVETET